MRWLTVGFILMYTTCAAQVVQNFSLTNVSNGQYVALDNFSSLAGVVLIFSSTDCPYDDYYLKRIQMLTETYKSQIAVVFINSNSDESMEQMKKYIDQNNITVPYLWDVEQKAMKSVAAHKSPECFLLSTAGGKFTVVYKGSIDNNPQREASANKTYLKDAIEKLRGKQKIEIKEVRPVGCSIR